MTYRILVADDLADEGIAILREAGEVTVRKGMSEDALRAELATCHALVVRSATRVTARSLELAGGLALIGRAGVGVDNIDVAAATERGIVVMNTPEAGAITTAEHAIALLLSLARHVPAADASVRTGKWEKAKFTGVEITGKTLGIIGLGRIGRVVAERARGLGMVILASDPVVKPAQAPAGVQVVTLDDLLASSDFVSVHVPLLDSTRHLLDRDRLLAMKLGARLVHAARGGIVDERALCDALRSGHLAGAALDVYEQEPLPTDSPLRDAPNLVLTPHLGASTHEARRGTSIEMARQVVLCLRRGVVLNGVNVPRIAPADAAQMGPWLELAHRLAGLLVQVFPGRLHALRLSLQGNMPKAALEPLTVGMLVGALKPVSSGAVTPVNAQRVAREHAVHVRAEQSAIRPDFQSLLRIEAQIDDASHFATGTVLHDRHGRMVELDGYELDAVLEPPILLTFHDDQPGVLGRIGTYLGERNINISRMQIAATNNGGHSAALGFLNLDHPLSPPQLAALREMAAIRGACQVL